MAQLELMGRHARRCTPRSLALLALVTAIVLCCSVGPAPVECAIVQVDCTSPASAGTNIVPSDDTVYALTNCTQTIGFNCIVSQDPVRCVGAAQFATSVRNVSILVEGGTTLPTINIEALVNVSGIVVRFVRVDTTTITPSNAGRGSTPILLLRAGGAIESIVVEVLSSTIVGITTRGLFIIGDGEALTTLTRQADISVHIADSFINATMWHLLEIVSSSTLPGFVIDSSNIRIAMERTVFIQTFEAANVVGFVQVRSSSSSSMSAVHVSVVDCSVTLRLLSVDVVSVGKTCGVHVFRMETDLSLTDSSVHIRNVSIHCEANPDILKRVRHTGIELVGRNKGEAKGVSLAVHGLRWTAKHSSDIVGVGALEWQSLEALTIAISDMSWDILADGSVGADAAFLTARSIFVVSADKTQWASNVSVQITNAAGTISVPRDPNRALQLGLASTATVLYLGDVVGSNVNVTLTNVSLLSVLDEAVLPLINNLLGSAALFPVSVPLMLVTSSSFTHARFNASMCRINVSLTVEASAVTVPFPILNVFSATSAILELAANCSRCWVNIDRTTLILAKLEMRPSPSSIPEQQIMGTTVFHCNRLFGVNATGFVLLMDTTPFSQCVGPFLGLLGFTKMKYASPYAVVHNFLHITVTDSVVRLPPPILSSGASMAATRPLVALYAPSVADNVVVDVWNATVLQPLPTPPVSGSSMGATDYHATVVLLSNNSLQNVAVRATQLAGWRTLLVARWTLGSTVRNTTVTVEASTLLHDPRIDCDAFVCGVSMALRPNTWDAPTDVGGLTIGANASAFQGAGYAAAFGGQLFWSGGGGANTSPRLSLGCNLLNGRATTAEVYRRLAHALRPVHLRALPDIVLFVDAGQAACAPSTATMTHGIAPPPMDRGPTPVDRTRSTSNAAVGTAGIAGASLSIASASSVVRLQATMGALRIRQRCSADDDGSQRSTSSSGLPTSDEEEDSATGSAFFDNPTQARVGTLGGGPTVQFAAGAVLGNAAIVVAFGVLVAFLLEAAALWGSQHGGGRQKERRRQRGGGGGGIVWVTRTLCAQTLSRLPGSGAAVFAMLLQPTVSCSFVLFITSGDQALPHRAAGIVVGCIGLICFAGGFLFLSLRVLRGFSLSAVCVRHPVPWRKRTNAKRGVVVRRSAVAWEWFDYFCSPSWEWTTTAAASDRNMRRGSTSPRPPSTSARAWGEERVLVAYGALFEGYRPGFHGYFAFDLCVACLCGLLDAFSLLGGCEAILWLLLAVSVAGAIVSGWLRPCASRLENAVLAVSNVLTVIAVALLLAAQSLADGDDTAAIVIDLEDRAATIALVQGVLCIATQLIAFATLLNVKYHFCRPPEYDHHWAATLWDNAATTVDQLLAACMRRRAALNGRRCCRHPVGNDDVQSPEELALEERRVQARNLQALVVLVCGKAGNARPPPEPQQQPVRPNAAPQARSPQVTTRSPRAP